MTGTANSRLTQSCLHWALLQTAAWAGMMVNYSRDVSLAEALGKNWQCNAPLLDRS